MQGASSGVRALCISQPAAATDGRSGWAARQVIRHSAYAHDVLLLPGSSFRQAGMARVLDKSIKR